ncbi:hypothetical protein QN348_22725, partial [Mucilaginibacter sp. 5C4]|nr:hypothetical protein [Mucilaginibacter sp. 5C4]
ALPGGRSASSTIGDKNVTFGGKNIGTKYELFREFVAEVDGGTFEYFGLNSSRVEGGRIKTIDGKARLRAVAGLNIGF